MKSYMRVTPLFAVLLAALLILAAPIAPSFAKESVEEKPTPDPVGEVELLPIPEPPLDQLEEAVAAQLREGREMVSKIAESEAAGAKDKAKGFGQLGQLYMAYELNDAAEVCLRNAMSLDPVHYNWIYSLAYLYQIMGKYEEAVPLYTRLLSREADASLLHIRLGECHRGLNRLDEARRHFEKAYESNPGEAATMARLGEVALAEKRYEEAVELLGSALELQPGANRLHYPLAMAYRGLKDMQNARLHLSRMGKVGVQPRDPLKEHLEQLVTGYRVHLINGKMAHAAGRPTDAIQEFQKAIDAAPERPEAYINLAATLGQIKKYRPAVDMLRKAVQIQPENETAHYNLGALLSFLGDYEAAEPHLRFVVRKNPDDALAHLTLADLFKAQQKTPQAFRHYMQAVNLDASFSDAWVWMSNYLIQTRQYKEALVVLETALEEKPRDGLIIHAMARLLAGCPDASLRDGRRALPMARAVYAASPHFEHALTLAMAHAQVDQCDEAVQLQTKAIDAAVNIPSARHLLGAMNRNLSHYKNRRPCRVPSF